jgi:hypothetical protein
MLHREVIEHPVPLDGARTSLAASLMVAMPIDTSDRENAQRGIINWQYQRVSIQCGRSAELARTKVHNSVTSNHFAVKTDEGETLTPGQPKGN